MNDNYVFGAKNDTESDKDCKINFDLSPRDLTLINQIAKRGVVLMAQNNIKLDYMMVQMDIATCHCNGCPLNLLSFALSDNSDFWSDMSGIGNNINRRTGKLMNNFVPKFKTVVQ